MEGRNKARGAILKMPGPPFMISAFDQDGFDRQQIPLQDGTMDGIEDPVLPSIADQHDEMPIRRKTGL